MNDKARSDLDAGLASLNRAVNGVAARLLGPKAIGRETLPEEPAISPEVDAAVGRAGDAVGKLLHATGEALKEHPLDPLGAAKAVQAHQQDTVTPPEGWSPLAGGLKSLGEGVLAVAEGVLDKVAPKKHPETPSDA
jgi:hypothetical protein